jgi:quinol monooxygenase YgiN
LRRTGVGERFIGDIHETLGHLLYEGLPVILVVVRNPIRLKYADDFPKLVEEFTAATRAEPGNICFDWSRSVDNPNMYILVEAFEDAAAGETHVNSEHFQKAMTLLPKLIEGTPEIVNVEVPGGWSQMAEVQGDAN